MQERRSDDRIYIRNDDGSSTALTMREAFRELRTDVDDLKEWRTQTQVYEKLLKWTLTMAATSSAAAIVDFLITVFHK